MKQQDQLKAAPPDINGNPYQWAALADIERVAGQPYDEMNHWPKSDDCPFPSTPLIAFSYRRIDRNRWVLLHGNEPVKDRGRIIIWDDSILKSALRPDVAIVNPSTRTYFTKGQ